MKITQYTVSQLQKMLRSKEISALELADGYLAQSDAEVGAYLRYTPEIARANAQKVDQAIASGADLAPLAGIPAGIKDNICTKGTLTTCASKMLGDFVPAFDAHVMDRLNGQDMTMLGKLNMDEFAMGSSTENSHFQVTHNPRDLTCAPGGSSGGSAAAVAADLAAFTLGSDTGGSIRQPASFCGVVGMKPTYGSVSRNGLIAFASSLDQIGPLTKTVEDSAIVLNAICGHDRKDSTSVSRTYGDMTAQLGTSMKGKKIALPKEYFGKGLSQEVADGVLTAAKVYESLGAIVEEVSLPSLELALPAYYVISSAEASSNLARFDGVRYGYRTDEFASMEELYMKSRSEGFGAEVKRRIMLGTFALSAGYYDAYYKKALQVRTLIMEEFNAVFAKFDAILAPVAPTVAYKLGEKTESPLEMYLGDIYTVPVNIAGLPAISLPCGETKYGLPIGMQLIGKAFDEANLLAIAQGFEREQGAYHLSKEEVVC